MNAGDFDARELPSLHQRIFVLRELIALWNVRVEIVLAVEFSEVREFRADCHADTKNMFDSLFVYDRQSSWMAHTNRADVRIWRRIERIVLRIAKHLRLRAKLCVDLKADCWNVFRHRNQLYLTENLHQAVLQTLYLLVLYHRCIEHVWIELFRFFYFLSQSFLIYEVCLGKNDDLLFLREVIGVVLELLPDRLVSSLDIFVLKRDAVKNHLRARDVTEKFVSEALTL